MFPFVTVLGSDLDGTTMINSGDVMRSCRYRRLWNARVLRMISLFSFFSSTPVPGSTKSAGDGLPVPTTMQSPISSPHVARTFSSMALNRFPNQLHGNLGTIMRHTWCRNASCSRSLSSHHYDRKTCTSLFPSPGIDPQCENGHPHSSATDLDSRQSLRV